jgi:hypothetical protein
MNQTFLGKRLDLFTQGRRDFLVGVEAQRPRLRAAVKCPVLRVAVAAPLGFEHQCAVPHRHFGARVGRVVEHYDDLGHPAAHALEATR